MVSDGLGQRFDERFDPVFQRGHEDDAIAFAPHPSPQVPVAVERAAELPSESLRGNPWVVVLWAIALVFSFVGLWMTWYSQELYATPNVDSVVTYYVLPAVLGAVAPWLLGVGLATLAGVVFLHATRWRR